MGILAQAWVAARSSTMLLFVGFELTLLLPLARCGSCWSSQEAEAECCARDTSVHSRGCWDKGRTFAACCRISDSSGYSSNLAIFVTLACMFALSVYNACARTSRRQVIDNRRHLRVEALQQNLDSPLQKLQVGGDMSDAESTQTASDSSEHKCGFLGALETDRNGHCPQAPKLQETSGEHWDVLDTRTCPCVLECGEAVLIQVLSALDGVALARFECVSRWYSLLNMASIAGIWRLVHVYALGGNPPSTLARRPASVDTRKRGGQWKVWWRWRQSLLQLPGSKRHKLTGRLSTMLVQRAGPHVFQASVQPLMPDEHWLHNLLDRLAQTAMLDMRKVADKRLAALSHRWHCYVASSAEIILADAHGNHTDHVNLFMSSYVSFAALAGQPRLFFAVLRQSAAGESHAVDIVHCAISPHPFSSLIKMAEEIVSFMSSGQDFAAALCGASWLIRLVFGPGWALRRCELAPTNVFLTIRKELLGTSTEGTMQASALQVIQWLLAALCPNPFGDGTTVLGIVSERLVAHMAKRVS